MRSLSKVEAEEGVLSEVQGMIKNHFEGRGEPGSGSVQSEDLLQDYREDAADKSLPLQVNAHRVGESSTFSAPSCLLCVLPSVAGSTGPDPVSLSSLTPFPASPSFLYTSTPHSCYLSIISLGTG